MPDSEVDENAPALNLVSAVAVKPPPFYHNNPAGWFRQLESQFYLSGITRTETNYHHVMAVLH